MKWELSLAASKMGETWSDGGPILLSGPDLPAIGYCSHEVTTIPPTVCDEQRKPLTSAAIHYKHPNHSGGESTARARSCHIVDVATVGHNGKNKS